MRIRHPASGMRIWHADPASSYSVSICTDITDKVQAFSSCFSPDVMMYRGGQRFAGDSDSPISIVPHLKLTSVL